MNLETRPFVHDYRPGAIHFGRGCVGGLDGILSELGASRALVVCGRNVGANRATMDPVEAGVGERLAGVFDRTTPDKSVETALAGVEAMREADADALVALGGGSSLDTAIVTAVLAARGLSLDDVRAEVAETGGLAAPANGADLPALVAVPTTLAGADLSTAAGTTVPFEDGGRAVTVSDEALMPDALCYDPDLFETTPHGALVGSAMNGFDKAIEVVYSARADPVTDATAVRSLRYLSTALPRLPADDPAVMERAVVGIVLAQYGLSTPEGSKISVVHAFGHGLRHEFGIQQGVAHAVVVPHVLELLFEHVDAGRRTLAEGLGVGADEDAATGVVRAVETVRDGLGLPSRLRDVEGVTRDGLPDAAADIHGSYLLSAGPEGFDPSRREIEAVLDAAW